MPTNGFLQHIRLRYNTFLQNPTSYMYHLTLKLKKKYYIKTRTFNAIKISDSKQLSIKTTLNLIDVCDQN